jgi:CDP-paratose 2-epimerase
MKKILITGGCGFLGSNLASYGIEQGYEIGVFDNLSRQGSAQNLAWLKTIGDFAFTHGDIRNRNDVETLVKSCAPDVIFHLGGQVAMTSSLENPYRDFEINVKGSVNLLDSVRKYSPQTAVIYSSTNKVYGDLEQFHYTETETRYVCDEFPKGYPETVALDFHSPYGCSKGAADQYMLDYQRFFGVKTVVFRHSSMYGSRQFATYDQGWIGWFCQKAVEKQRDPLCKPFTISGNGKQVRDILHADDMIALYYRTALNIDKVCGQAYNIGGSMEQSLSLLELFGLLETMLGVKLEYSPIPARQSDQRVFVADITKIQDRLGWSPKVSSREGIAKMLDWIAGDEA